MRRPHTVFSAGAILVSPQARMWNQVVELAGVSGLVAQHHRLECPSDRVTGLVVTQRKDKYQYLHSGQPASEEDSITL